jgi:hypothetical protein
VALVLALGACSGGADSSRPTPTTAAPVTTTAANLVPAPGAVPAAVPGQAATTPTVLAKLPGVFAPIPDHEYLDVSAAITEATTARFLANPDARSVVALDGRWVMRYGKRVALASAVGLDPKVAAMPGGAEGMIAAVTEGAQSSKQVKLAGEMVTVAVDANGMVTMAWLKGPLVLVVVGRNELRVTPVASALIDANK